jgi:NitT/TauT family transport system substrate-binding protein
MRRIAIVVACLLIATSAGAEDTLKIAAGQRGNWEQSPPELGQEAGIFKKHGLALDILWTDGGGQTQQAVVSGSVDVGTGVGTYGVFGAFSKGAPVRIIGNSTTGANDLYFYVPSASPVHSLKDTGGKTVAYSTTGSSTNLLVLGIARQFDVKLIPTATGSPPATFTQVMSGQVDVGWAAPPFGLKDIQDGRIRIIGRGGEVPVFDGQTVRVMITSASALAQKRDQIARFMQAYRETLDWMYTNPDALTIYAKFAGTTPELAKLARDQFYPETNLDPDRITGIEGLQKDAVTFKYLSAPLPEDKLKVLIQPFPKGG